MMKTSITTAHHSGQFPAFSADKTISKVIDFLSKHLMAIGIIGAAATIAGLATDCPTLLCSAAVVTMAAAITDMMKGGAQ